MTRQWWSHLLRRSSNGPHPIRPLRGHLSQLRGEGLVAAVLVLFLLAAPAHAGLVQSDLDTVGLTPPANAALPQTLAFTDDTGRPSALPTILAERPATLVLLMDFTCRSVCGVALDQAAAALASPALDGARPGLLVVGLDPKDTLADLRAAREAHLGHDTQLTKASHWLHGDEAAIRVLTADIGYRFTYDPANDQFAHPAAAMMVDAQGRLVRALSSLSLDPDTLRLAAVDAGAGHLGGMLDQIRLRCYAFDPATGLYTSQVQLWLRIGAVLTLAALAGLIAWGIRRSRPASAERIVERRP